MTSPTLVRCPHCRSEQEVGPDEMGRPRACVACGAEFTPGAPPAPPSGDPGAVERVAVECPGCHRPLRVRTEYLGRTLTCRHCGRAFVAGEGAGGAGGGPP